MATVHLAGDAIRIGSYVIQRCLLCGEPLLEFDLRTMASTDGSVSTLALGGFYEFDGNCRVLLKESEGPHFASDLDLPDDCCIRKRPANHE